MSNLIYTELWITVY